MAKIAMIGAGSLVFCKTLSMDILATEALADSELCLMNRTQPKLDKMEAFLKGVIEENNCPTKLTATLDRREALDGADYVIIMIQVGGLEAFRMDYEIPLKQYEYICKDGSTFWGELKMTLLRDSNNNFISIQGNLRDVTERKEAEEKLGSIMNELVAINEKLGVIGKLTRHDARNKLAVIANNVYLTRHKLKNNPDALKYLGGIESAVDQMDKIFDFARQYEMLGVEELSYLDVERNVDEAITLLSGVSTVTVVNECQGLTVIADSLLRQLFYNMVENTLKYGEEVTQIRIYYAEEENELKLVYEDDGAGISENEKEKIFQYFTTLSIQ